VKVNPNYYGMVVSVARMYNNPEIGYDTVKREVDHTLSSHQIRDKVTISEEALKKAHNEFSHATKPRALF